LRDQFILPVIRSANAETTHSIATALIDAGFLCIEITLMSEGIFAVIEKLKKKSHVCVGAGTVLSLKQAQRASQSGADFLVSPGLTAEIVPELKTIGVPYFPGVMTPTEVTQALTLGFETLKLFPVGPLGGPRYLQSLSAPFTKVNWILSGGVKIADIPSFDMKGVTALSIGEDLFPKELVRKKDWIGLSRRAAEILKVRQSKSKLNATPI